MNLRAERGQGGYQEEMSQHLELGEVGFAFDRLGVLWQIGSLLSRVLVPDAGAETWLG